MFIDVATGYIYIYHVIFINPVSFHFPHRNMHVSKTDIYKINEYVVINSQ